MGYPVAGQQSGGYPRAEVFNQGAKLPPPSVAAQAVDMMIQDPAIAAELRSRLGGRPYQTRRGHRWIARRDGTCNKTVGWIINPQGNLLSRECGGPIKEGEECWRQDGHLYYGQGCHAKGLVVLPKLFAGQHFINESVFADNLPDRRVWLDKAEDLWSKEVAAGKLSGEWGSIERKESEAAICKALHDVLMLMKTKNVVLLAKPTPIPKKIKVKPVPTNVAAIVIPKFEPQSKAMKADKQPVVPARIEADKNVAEPLLGVVKRFSGDKARVLAEGHALAFNTARPKHLKPLTVHQEGSQWVVVNADLANADAKRKEKMLPGITSLKDAIRQAVSAAATPLDPAQPTVKDRPLPTRKAKKAKV